jgi:ABC-2 type transport system ATP-binding protein
MSAISVAGLGREFRVRRRGSLRSSPVVALANVTFTVEPGESVGYIGANGAGKSTTIKILTGILVPTAGHVRTVGLDPVRQRRELARHVGVVFGQRSQLWWDLPLRESFEILCAIHRLDSDRARRRTDELVELLAMGDTLDTPVRQLSLGQRMRGEIAAALLHSPELLILDEPTIGLDVLSKLRLREFLLAERAEHGTTLMLTTHDMSDVERLCPRVLVVDHGTLAYDGTLPGLARTVGAQRVLVVDLLEPVASVPVIPGVTPLAPSPEDRDGDEFLRLRLAFDPEVTTAAAVLGAVSAVVPVRDLSIEEPDIDDVVRRIYLTRRPDRQA